ncbi:hypothetical protein Taro_008755 [Colocasia esculenta]|uniref:Uncharacterized protein n=1 Tax=Colocasia esculenta TaxID=4460 RepID=A0A843U224_COLES|nr:hypothetical protein [Colocasia esculenta]
MRGLRLPRARILGERIEAPRTRNLNERIEALSDTYLGERIEAPSDMWGDATERRGYLPCPQLSSGLLKSPRSTDKEGVHSLVRDSWEDAICLSGTLLLPKGLTPIQADLEIANSDSLART